VRDNTNAIRAAETNVVQTLKSDTTTFAVSATTEQASNISGLEATITPTEDTSKVLVTVTLVIVADVPNNAGIILYRGSTAIGVGNAAGSRKRTTLSHLVSTDYLPVSLTFLDTPATIAATTYGVRIYNTRTATTNYFVNRGATDSDSNQQMRSSSVITLQEIPA
jgi:hypothetical protein